ncbi:Serine/threonine-protein kinase MAK (Male germ cell-associated kinase) (Protein kinase RCK) [Durusdinium trenchii]|uniref:Serine/threonine-protein kinase MAK (Male germ cell-associated kinase) (Protein kinase RCK) n=1 Tax=Durusdinium trenchii TaxID=1381693 RepID=A0ABP0JTR9_9DINO
MAIEKDYDVLDRLGEGAFGKVYKARHKKTEELVAVKQIKLGAKSWDEACKSTELAALRQLRHPFIVRLKELLRNQLDGSLYYIFEYVDSDLFRLIRQNPSGLEEAFGAVLARQLFAGLAHIHQHNFFHRDIKPENILYETSRQVLRIADFGESRSLRARPPFTDYVGTRWYRAPECLLRDRGYSSPVDVWSSGLVFAELLRGSPVFMGTSSIDQLYKIFTVLGQPISDWPEFARLAEACRFRATSSGSGLQSVLPRASSRAVAILSEILMLNPRRRPMARKVLEHSYFNFLPPLEMDRLDTARSGASASMMHYLPERSDSRNSFHFNDQGSLDFGAKLQASRPETPVLVPGFPPCPPSRPKSEVCVDDVDLDAELDKILGDAPRQAEEPECVEQPEFPQRVGSTDSWPLEMEVPSPLPEREWQGDSQRRGFPEIPPLHVSTVAISRGASPDSRGDMVDALLNDLADLGVGDDLPSSARSARPPPPAFPGTVETDKEIPWSPDECLELRRVVKRVVRGHPDTSKEQIWLEVSREMGGRRAPHECQVQYSRDYRADKLRRHALASS